jgi:hypothetical protein
MDFRAIHPDQRILDSGQFETSAWTRKLAFLRKPSGWLASQFRSRWQTWQRTAHSQSQDTVLRAIAKQMLLAI